MNTFGNAPSIHDQIVPAIVHHVQRAAGDSYRIQAEAPSLRAENPDERLTYHFDGSGIEATSWDTPWRWTMRLAGYGSPDQLLRCDAVEPVGVANRVEYRHPELTEWYLNGPLGLEQGFTLAAPPSHCATARQLALRIAFEGDLSAVVRKEDGSIDLVDADNDCVLNYGQLYVSDATGRALPSRFSLGEEGSEAYASIVFDVHDAVYPITVDPLVKHSRLVTADDGAAGDKFGFAVSISGTTAVVGAYRADGGSGPESGVVYVFVRNIATNVWTQQAQLVASDGASGDHFGYAVSIDGNTIAVGAADAHIGGTSDAGAVYIFTRSGTTWTQQQKVTAADPSASDRLGFAVSVNGDTVAAGAPYAPVVDIDQGATYVFVRSGTTWSQQQKITAGGQNDNLFGCSLAVRGNKLIIGASAYDEPVVAQGAAYLYSRTGSTWSFQQKLTLSTGEFEDNFGTSVDMSPNGLRVIVGSPRRNTSYGTDTGSAFVYAWNGTSWALEATLLINAAANDRFGQTVAISDKAALVGSPFFSSGRGIAYYFIRSGSSWQVSGTVSLSGAAANDSYATSMAMTNDDVIVGAPGRNNSIGTVHVFWNGPGEHINPCDPVCGIVVTGKEKLGNPITIRDGEKQEEVMDLQVHSPFGSLDLKRVYRQNAHDDYQFMGLGWTHSHAMFLSKIVGSPNEIIVYWGNGAQASFVETSPDFYEGTAGVVASIVWDTNEEAYTLTTASHSTVKFAESGYVLSQELASGEMLTYDYDANSGALAEV
ncbi:MAG: hypothetical protein JNL42_18425, partial [Anaerolineae bacterium]|nr:hypothetical protein [Anaerolineae bacterium]